MPIITEKPAPTYKPVLYWFRKENSKYHVYQTNQWKELTPRGLLLKSRDTPICVCDYHGQAKIVVKALEQTPS